MQAPVLIQNAVRTNAGSNVRFLFLAGILFFLPLGIIAQQPDYSTIFGADWDNALRFEKENRDWMKKSLEAYGISYDHVIAVVFPELVRYSSLRDKMEISVLKALYINLGERYADFSIGRFQIKPSFAEKIRIETNSLPFRRDMIRFRLPEDYESVPEYRKSIVGDLENINSAFTYVIAFYMICEKKFRLTKMDERDRILFLATAYNYGIDKTSEEIYNMTGRKFFNTKLFKTDNYPYSDVSIYWFDKYRNGIKTDP